MGLFEERKNNIPVWFMRQAGRYHSHYRKIREKNDFMSLCKTPRLACEITMGPMEEFGFDGAIMFSDLLFPLEQLGFGLSYAKGPPTLQMSLKDSSVLKKIKPQTPSEIFYNFQRETLKLIGQRLSSSQTLLGFIGAPFTLYTYAMEGAHKGNLIESKRGLYDGRFDGFMEKLLPSLEENLAVQADSPADALCLFDTAAGELSLYDYKRFVLPVIRQLTKTFKRDHPAKKLIYYSKQTSLNHLLAIEDESIDVLGIDWRLDLPEVLSRLGDDYYIQGNLDPSHLFLAWPCLEEILGNLWRSLERAPLNRWIFGLGHGVLPKTPEENVKKTVEFIKKNLSFEVYSSLKKKVLLSFNTLHE